MSREFRAKPAQLLPALLSIAASGALSYGLRSLKVEVEAITPFPETLGGVTLNAALFVTLLVGVGSLMYILLKYGLKKLVRYMLMGALSFTTFFLAYWYSELLTDGAYPSLSPLTLSKLGFSILVTSLLMLGVHGMRGAFHAASISMVGALTGTFLGTSIPGLTAMVLLAALALYDLYAVYRGPVGKIARTVELEDLAGAVLTYGDLTMGMGDMVFYSMLASISMVNFGPISFMAASAGLLGGVYLGLKMLEGREMFPGLPLALVLGMALMLIGGQLENLVHLLP